MEIQTTRLTLLPCTESMISTYGYTAGPHIQMHLKELSEDPTLLGWGPWLILNNEDGKVIGDLGFKGKPNTAREVEIGYGITPSAQNRGYATEAVREIILWVLKSNEVDKVTAECLVDNIPSIRVLEKVKMTNIGHNDGMLKWEITKEGIA
jgi:[ribosomal protein S5]-alanine N-acetyltransferase